MKPILAVLAISFAAGCAEPSIAPDSDTASAKICITHATRDSVLVVKCQKIDTFTVTHSRRPRATD